MHKNQEIYKELLELHSSLASFQKINVFTVPEGYFEVLPTSILHAVSAVSDVPQGYFESLADSILLKIRAENTGRTEEPDLSFLAAVKNKNVFQVPEGYFASVTDAVYDRIDADRNEFIQSLPKNNVFTVPEQYFENLETDITNRLQSGAKVVSMNSRSFFLKYAVAACVTAIIGLSIFTALDKNTRVNLTPTDKIEFAEAGTILQNNSFDKAIETVGDDEILKYLEKNGDDIDAAMVASLTEDKTPPAVDEYIFNDKALDAYIDELKLNKAHNN